NLLLICQLFQYIGSVFCASIFGRHCYIPRFEELMLFHICYKRSNTVPVDNWIEIQKSRHYLTNQEKGMDIGNVDAVDMVQIIWLKKKNRITRFRKVEGSIRTVIIEIEDRIYTTSKGVDVILIDRLCACIIRVWVHCLKNIPRCVNEVLELDGNVCAIYIVIGPAIMAIVIATAAVSISMVAVDKSNTGNIIVGLLLMMEIMEASL
ncbi:hypothetical protein RFI_04338, partial [Reticulomyxa filosa]